MVFISKLLKPRMRFSEREKNDELVTDIVIKVKPIAGRVVIKEYLYGVYANKHRVQDSV